MSIIFDKVNIMPYSVPTQARQVMKVIIVKRISQKALIVLQDAGYLVIIR